MSPITNHSFLKQNSCPEIAELGENSKRSHEKQQETMKLYNKAGVNLWLVVYLH
jgi:membrane protein insertase Oxa1/YidC/SpoIIIJ